MQWVGLIMFFHLIMQESLRLAVLHTDEESERIAEQFLGGEMSVEQFVNQYLEKRTVSGHIAMFTLRYMYNKFKFW